MQDPEEIRVSVIIPVFNAAKCVTRAIDSVLAQTEQRFEIIVVDDASSDNTREVVGNLAAKDRRIKLFLMEANGGPSAARNRGFEVARGKWLAILDADDAFRPSRLEVLCDLADQHSLDAIGDDIVYYDELAGTEVGPGNFVSREGLSPVTLDDYLASATYKVGLLEAIYRDDMTISLLKLVFLRDFLRAKKIKYSVEYRYCEDFLFYYDLLYSGAKLGLFSRPLYLYTEQLGSISRVSSPHSKTVSNRGAIVVAVDQILLRDRKLTDKQRSLLELRKRSASSMMRYESIRKELKRSGKFQFLCLLARHRDVWFYFLREVRCALVGLLRQKLHRRAA